MKESVFPPLPLTVMTAVLSLEIENKREEYNLEKSMYISM